MQVETDFRHWIVRRIEQYRFKEDQDFRAILSESSGGRPAKEYALTLRMAQHLCLTEDTDRGEMARDWIWAREAELRRRESAPVERALTILLLRCCGVRSTMPRSVGRLYRARRWGRCSPPERMGWGSAVHG